MGKLAEINAQVAATLFGADDGVCLERATLVTDAWRAHADEPPAIRRALALRHVLLNMTLDVESNPVLAGNTSSAPRAWMQIPEHGFDESGQHVLEHAELQGLLDGRIPDDLRDFWEEHREAGGFGHLAVDYQMVVERGLRSIIDELDALGDGGDERQRTYRRGMRIGLEAVIAWAQRYAEAARQAAERCDDAARRACHRRVAEACQRVPAEPADNLFEAAQAIALTHLAVMIEGHRLSVSLGLPDRAMQRFAAEAAADPDEAADVLAALLLVMASSAYTGKASLTQAVTVGGADHAGLDRCNAITLAWLEAFDRVAVADPHLFLRWHEGLDATVRDKAIAMLAGGRSMPLLVHDGPTANGLIRAGIDPADAWDYCVIGCNEIGIPGRAWDTASPLGLSFNDIDLLNQVLLGLGDAATVSDTEELVRRLEPVYDAKLRAGLARRALRQPRVAEAMPTPYTTALMRGGPQRGRDLLAAMAYRTPCAYTRGLANAANALAAIEALVFRQRRYTLGELIAAMRNDLDDPAVREALSATPKWANDDERADHWARRLVALRDAVLDRLADEGFDRPVVCHVVRSLHHMDGMRIGASLDGRRAGEPVGDSIGGISGTMHAGPTAMLNSVCKLDAASGFGGGYNLNLTLAGDQTDPAVVAALTEGFFAGGGQELQINVLSAAALRAAKAEPTRFSDLVVRVAGLSARFIELSELEQDELIARAEAAEHAAAPA